MDSNILKKGFSLVELCIAMGVIAILASAVTPVAMRALEIKAAEKTIAEVAYLQEAARHFYQDHKDRANPWPSDFQELKDGGYINAAWSMLNPWSYPYAITSNTDSKLFSLTINVPRNLKEMFLKRLPEASVPEEDKQGNQVSQEGQPANIDIIEVTSAIGSSIDATIIPSGVIVAWSGLLANVPNGWALCNGENGTPNLLDRFIVGASADENGMAKSSILFEKFGLLQYKGGSISHDHGEQTGSHQLMVDEVPALQVTLPMFSPNQASPNGPTVQRGQYSPDGSLTLTTNGGGGGHTHLILKDYHVPPFYALAFIMKL